MSAEQHQALSAVDSLQLDRHLGGTPGCLMRRVFVVLRVWKRQGGREGLPCCQHEHSCRLWSAALRLLCDRWPLLGLEDWQRQDVPWGAGLRLLVWAPWLRELSVGP